MFANKYNPVQLEEYYSSFWCNRMIIGLCKNLDRIYTHSHTQRVQAKPVVCGLIEPC